MASTDLRGMHELLKKLDRIAVALERIAEPPVFNFSQGAPIDLSPGPIIRCPDPQAKDES